MKILSVVQGYAPAVGGTEFLVQNIAESLVNDFGDEVTVFTTNCFNGEGFWNPSLPRMQTGWSEINGVKVLRFPVRSRVSQALRPAQKIAHILKLPYNDWLRTYFGGPIIAGLQKEIAKFPADVIAASSFPLLHMFDALAAGKASGKPVVINGGIHPQDKWGFGRANIIQAVRESDLYLAYTGYETQYLGQQGIPAEHIRVVGCGVHMDEFTHIDPLEAKRALGLPLDKPIIGFIGQIGLHKGVDTLIKAMPYVWEQFPEAHLLLAGSRAMYAQQLDSIIETWPEAYRQRLHLFYNFPETQKPTLFNAVDLFTYASGYESFGIAYLEAWASKKPVIGTWSGAIPWVVSAGQDGLLVHYHDHEELTEALLILLRNPDWAKQMGERGYEKTLRQYTWKQVAQRFRDSYSFALEQRAVQSRKGL
jgi:glycosyltransferase involved in cell wall biosynthesis